MLQDVTKLIQGELTFGPRVRPPLFTRHPPCELQKLDQFVEFHLNNPAVFEHFRRFAELRIKKHSHGGARQIGERVRWELALETVHDENEPKINDWWWPYYARLLVALDDRFAEFFAMKHSFPFEPAEILERIELKRRACQ